MRVEFMRSTSAELGAAEAATLRRKNIDGKRRVQGEQMRTRVSGHFRALVNGPYAKYWPSNDRKQ